MEKKERKTIRLKGFDYNAPGAYFITICTKNNRCLLSKLGVGTGVLDGPQLILTKYGKIAEKQIQAMDELYENLSVDKYVVMPNHIHLLIRILCTTDEYGPSRTPVPTRNSIISRFVSTFKRFCDKEYGENIWQPRSYDRVIRNDVEYQKIYQYIDENPIKWELDKFYKTR